MILGHQPAVEAELQRQSKLLFGNQDRLLVAAAVALADRGSLYASALAELAGISEVRVGAQLRHFVDAGLLVKLPKVGGERRVYYARVDSPLWTLCAALKDEIAARVAADGHTAA